MNRTQPLASARVVFASSQDDRFPPANMLDGNPRTFWSSTGLYPQDLIFELDPPATPAKLVVHTAKVKALSVAACPAGALDAGGDLDPFDTLVAIDMPENNTATAIPLKLSRAVSHVRVTVNEGYSDYCAVFSVVLE
ncbi:Heat shock protein beta-11 [Allomyces arbusculus]|nr:Heat shock protein beta-11 [Allomyces arbusculus]